MTKTPDPYETYPLPREIRDAEPIALLIGAAGLIVCIIVWILGSAISRWSMLADAFYRAWLFAWLLFLGASLGSMAAVMVHHLTDGRWGLLVRRFGEAAAMVLPLLFILSVPILVGMRHLYPWARQHVEDPVVLHKRPYLNGGFFILRMLLYFAVWTATAWLLREGSLRHDRAGDERIARRLRVVSALGLVVYFVTMSFASVDWIMSLEPRWYSTVFGFVIIMGQAVTGFSVMIVSLVLLRRLPPFNLVLRRNHLNDLGNLLLTCIILWAYNSFAQLLVQWMGNMVEEIGWYVKRTSGTWRLLAAMLIFFDFFVPFILLLMRNFKRRAELMLWLCAGLLVMRAIDLFWLVAPAGDQPYPNFRWGALLIGLAALAAVGGLWTAAYLRLLGGHPLMPLGDRVPVVVEPSGELSPEHTVTPHEESIGENPAALA
ncbi:MAG: hypothetical protein JWN51_2058 [Phycisphaerales bacterium]|nr:hypothetical protein [Phycisphaerales bacterium]